MEKEYNVDTTTMTNPTESLVSSFDMKMPSIRFWMTPGAPTPKVSTAGSGGLDLFIDDFKVEDDKLKIHTGVHIELPRGHVGLLIPRSSTGVAGFRLKNTVGVIDSDYRGEIMLIADRFDAEEELVDIGKKIAQLVIVPVCPFPMEQVGNFEDLTVTSRDTGGFGSTGE
jgi:dUTP pyrophosphatase|tara:strand:- start:67 stop:573 length:507 start_codon:yes stop_codon:yes gene_type:complete